MLHNDSEAIPAHGYGCIYFPYVIQGLLQCLIDLETKAQQT